MKRVVIAKQSPLDGKYFVVFDYVNNRKEVAHVLRSFVGDDGDRIEYQCLTGPEKDGKFNAKIVSQSVFVFETFDEALDFRDKE